MCISPKCQRKVNYISNALQNDHALSPSVIEKTTMMWAMCQQSIIQCMTHYRKMADWNKQVNTGWHSDLSYGVPLPLKSAVFAKSVHRGSFWACWLHAGNMSTICLDLQTYSRSLEHQPMYKMVVWSTQKQEVNARKGFRKRANNILQY